MTSQENDFAPDHHIWNPLFILLFVFLVVLAYVWLAGDRQFVRELYSLDPFTLFVMGLATLRIIRLVTFDRVTYFFRIMFLDGHEGGYAKPRSGVRRTISELIECIWCTGMWGALVVIGLYFSGTFGVFAVYLLALSALGTVFQNLSQMITRIGVK